LKLGARTYTHAVVTAMRECELFAALSMSEAQLNSAELSEREREVLSLSAQGNSMEEIAVALGVSVARVREHSRTATLKLGARTYVQAVAAAMRKRLIEGCGDEH
jgi:DNA-binding CsgD family transcriptional regulator